MSERGSEISEDNWQVKHKMFMWKVSTAKRLRNTTQTCETAYIQTVLNAVTTMNTLPWNKEKLCICYICKFERFMNFS